MCNIFVSDIHLGIKDCNAEDLDKFLKKNKPRDLYLVGDIIDMWRLKNKSFWPQSHVNLIRRFLSLAKKETTIHWIIGNHDAHLNNYTNKNLYFEFGNINIKRITTYKEYLVLHGDQFDTLKNLGKIGDKCYAFVSYFTNRSGKVRNSIKSYVQHKIRFQEKAINAAKSGRYKGVICGHTHSPKINDNYINCGDMIENYSLIVDNSTNEKTFKPELIFL